MSRGRFAMLGAVVISSGVSAYDVGANGEEKFARRYAWAYQMNAKVFAIANTKGGAGKTCIATNLSAFTASRGLKVLFIDADKQKSSTMFKLSRGERGTAYDEVQIVESTLHEAIPRLKDSYDFIFIDVGGKDDGVIRSAVVASDIVVVPVPLDPYSVWGTEEFLELLDKVRELGVEVDVKILVNMDSPRRIVKKCFEALVEIIDGREQYPILESRIRYLRAWPESASEGQTVEEWESERPRENGKATKELQMLVEELQIHADSTEAQEH